MFRNRNYRRDPKTQRPSERDDRHFLWVVILFLIVGGGTVIALVFGPSSLLLALPILVGGSLLILMPFLLLQIISWGVKKYRDREEKQEDE